MLQRLLGPERPIEWGRVIYLTALVTACLLLLVGVMDVTLVVAPPGINLTLFTSVWISGAVAFLLLMLLDYLHILAAIPLLSDAHEGRGIWWLDSFFFLAAIISGGLALIRGFLDERFLLSAACLALATLPNIMRIRGRYDARVATDTQEASTSAPPPEDGLLVTDEEVIEEADQEILDEASSTTPVSSPGEEEAAENGNQ